MFVPALLSYVAVGLTRTPLSTCPDLAAQAISSQAGIVLADCGSIDGTDKDSPYISITDNESACVDISMTTFALFQGTIINIQQAGAATLTDIVFDRLHGSHGQQAAVVVGSVNEVRFVSATFKDFTDASAILSNSQTESQILLLQGIVLENVMAVETVGVVQSTFRDVYGDDIVSTDCSGYALFSVSGTSNSPVLRGLVVTRCVIATSGAMFYGLNPSSFFSLERSAIKDSVHVYIAAVPLYFEACEFLATTFTEDALRAVGQVSVMDSTFSGFTTAIFNHASPGPLYVCRSRFVECGCCIDVPGQQADIVNCIFQDYNSIALQVGVSVTVMACAFISDAPFDAILFIGTLTVSQTCFSRDGHVIDGPRGGLTLGPGCCFKAVEAVAISGSADLSEAGSPFGCESACTDQWVSVNTGACAVEPRPSPVPTRTAFFEQLCGAPIPEATQTARFTLALRRLLTRRSVICRIGMAGFLFLLSDF
jgi:hypothetical protein